MNRIVTAGALALGLCSSAAVAADIQADSVHTWTGFYVGASAGGFWGDLDTFGPATTPAEQADPEGGLVAIQGGYDHQFDNNVVLGGEVFIPLWASDETTANGAGTYTGNVNWAVFFNGRLGYAFEAFLPYIKGGFFIAEGEIDFDCAFGAVCSAVTDATHTGWDIGAGLEYAFAERWSARIEYLHAETSREQYRFNEAEYTNDSVTLGVNYRF